MMFTHLSTCERVRPCPTPAPEGEREGKSLKSPPPSPPRLSFTLDMIAFDLKEE